MRTQYVFDNVYAPGVTLAVSECFDHNKNPAVKLTITDTTGQTWVTLSKDDFRELGDCYYKFRWPTHE